MELPLRIPNTTISIGEGKPFLIAEIGKGFIQTQEEQSVETYLTNALALLEAARDSGADAAKFQTHTVEDEQLNIPIIAPHFEGGERYRWVKRNEDATPLEFWQELKRRAKQLGILFFSTPMSRGAARKLDNVGVDLWKVGSGDILDFPMLEYIAETGKPVIISSGMSTIEELDLAINFLKQRTSAIVLMHCISKYPCRSQELYLDTVPYLAERYGVPVGFSDHSIGYDAALAAIGKGACVIEKHFSFSRDLWGSDHKVAMTPAEFKRMVDGVQSGERRNPDHFGIGVKEMDDQERVFRPVFRKSLMAGRDIAQGEMLDSSMVYAMRPQQFARGLPSELFQQVIGKKAIRDIKKYYPLTMDILV